MSKHELYNCSNGIAGGAETLACQTTHCHGGEWFDKAGTLEECPHSGVCVCVFFFLPSFHHVPCHVALEEGLNIAV